MSTTKKVTLDHMIAILTDKIDRALDLFSDRDWVSEHALAHVVGQTTAGTKVWNIVAGPGSGDDALTLAQQGFGKLNGSN